MKSKPKSRKRKQTAAITKPETPAQVQEPKNLSEILANLPQEKKELIKRTVAKDATDDELELFFHVCARNNTHPLDRLIVFTKFREGDSDEGEKKVVLISTIDFFRSRSFAYGRLAGIDPPVFEGELTEVGGRKVPAYCRVTGYQMVGGMRVAYHGEARWTEFCPQGKRKAIWLKQPHNMLAKCAEAQLHRKIAPTLLHNIYLREEVDWLHDNNNRQNIPVTGQEVIKELIERVGAKQVTRQEEAKLLETSTNTVDVGQASFWIDKLQHARTERQVLSIKREAAKNLNEDDMKALDKAIIEKLSTVTAPEARQPEHDIDAGRKAELAIRLRDTIRRIVPNYLVRGVVLSDDEAANVNQLLVEGFGTADMKVIAAKSPSEIEKGIERLVAYVERNIETK